MSDFVNYQKRDIELPDGAKDLIDILRKSQRETAPQGALSAPPGPAVDYYAKGVRPLSELSLELRELLRPGNATRTLSLEVKESELEVSLFFLGSLGELMGSLVFKDNPEWVKIVRKFFISRHLELAPPTAVPPSPVFPNVSVQNRYNLAPLPKDLDRLILLIDGLLRDVCSLSDTSLVSLCRVETR